MSIPNVTFRWCQKQAECKWCEKPIEAATAMVAVFFWNKGDDGRKWNNQYCYHPECWIAQGYDYLERNPFVPSYTGKAKMQLTEEERRQRFLAVRRYNALLQRLNKLDESSEPIKYLELECQMLDVVIEMNNLGGRIPKKWLARL